MTGFQPLTSGAGWRPRALPWAGIGRAFGALRSNRSHAWALFAVAGQKKGQHERMRSEHIPSAAKAAFMLPHCGTAEEAAEKVVAAAKTSISGAKAPSANEAFYGTGKPVSLSKTRVFPEPVKPCLSKQRPLQSRVLTHCSAWRLCTILDDDPG